MKKPCEMIKQGYKKGSCLVKKGDTTDLSCNLTFKIEKNIPTRLIKSAHLSRPEHYFSIYQSGCNMDCKKCHSWTFTQNFDGKWFTPDDILKLAIEYAETVTVEEPRERATSYHAADLCRGCGACIKLKYDTDPYNGDSNLYLSPTNKRGSFCPGRVKQNQIVLSPQGIGPARNIIGFTGGDLACRPEWIAGSTEKIKNTDLGLWVLYETNGYGLTPKNLEIFKSAGVDSFWLDIKAYDGAVHKKLTGVENDLILRLPEEMIKKDFVIEVLTLFIPGWVEENQIAEIARIIYRIDKDIPFTILAFFPEYKMKDARPPSLNEMLKAYFIVKEIGLKNVRLGNLGIFMKTEEDCRILLEKAPNAI